MSLLLEGRIPALLEFFYSFLFRVVWKSRYCFALREKLLDFSVPRDREAEDDSVLGLQMLLIITIFSFLFFLFLLQTVLRLQSQNLALRAIKARAESGP